MVTPNALLSAPPTSAVQVKGYDRSKVSAGIVHVGVGGFHRAHQAVVVDDLLAEGHHEWGILGVGVMPGDRLLRDALTAQDCAYTLVTKHTDGTRDARVIGSIVGYLFAPEDPEAVVRTMADPATRIVSLTITEGGYAIDDATGEFVGSEASRADLQPGAAPSSVFGLVVEALSRRRAAGQPPFTVMSCDNVQGNGDVARRSFTSFARLRDPDLARWMEEHVCFPNSMVDRITPVTTEADRLQLEQDTGVVDRWPVVCEPFFQWVLEDSFGAGRPPWQDAGVQLVDSVEPYELMKLRLLNAGHQVLGYLGYLAGHRYVHEVAQDPLFAELLMRYLEQEGTPALHEVPGIDLADYRRSLLERFANPNVADHLARICLDSSDRIPKFVLPVVRSRLEAGASSPVAVLTVAAWARYAEGQDETGQPIEVVDRRSAELAPYLDRQRREPAALLEAVEVFGDLGRNPVFGEAFTSCLAELRTVGSRRTVQRLLDAD